MLSYKSLGTPIIKEYDNSWNYFSIKTNKPTMSQAGIISNDTW